MVGDILIIIIPLVPPSNDITSLIYASIAFYEMPEHESVLFCELAWSLLPRKKLPHGYVSSTVFSSCNMIVIESQVFSESFENNIIFYFWTIQLIWALKKSCSTFKFFVETNVFLVGLCEQVNKCASIGRLPNVHLLTDNYFTVFAFRLLSVYDNF